ncbi:MAG TPA: DMT family transporter, partial [Candidatus Thermoplasmatota archaeon]|nr:DMT family transporter [Candidatus Thermoplasmatota archaeon]
MHRARGAAWALLAAAMFGLVAVAAKGIDASALAIACGAYLVAGVALLPALRGLRLAPRDRWRVAAMTLFGGVLAPVALFQGLRMTTAVDASLLLTLEMAFTAGLASVYLHERVRPRALVGLALLFGAAALVALPARDAGGERSLAGNLLVAAAALAWSVDNTVSTGLATRHDPKRLIAAKSLGGGLAL